MTTNNPPIAAWAPSTALAKLASRHNNAPCVLTDGPAEFNDVALIRLADYQRLQAETERLQAECEKLRTAMIEAKSYIDHYMYGGSIYREPAAEAIAIIDAAMEGDKP